VRRRCPSRAESTERTTLQTIIIALLVLLFAIVLQLSLAGRVDLRETLGVHF